jgi:hypothetical protein
MFDFVQYSLTGLYFHFWPSVSPDESKLHGFDCVKVQDGDENSNLPKVGVISNSHKISDSIARICRNDTSKLAPSLHARHDPRLKAGSA